MTFYLLILLASVAYATESICYGYFEKHNKIVVLSAVTVFSFTLLTLTSIIYISIDPNSYFANISPLSILGIFINSVIMIFQILLWLKALKYIGISIADPVSNFQLVLGALFSWLIFNDVLPIQNIILLGFIFLFCVVLGIEISKTKKEGKGLKLKQSWKGLVYLLGWIAFTVFKQMLTKSIILDEVNPIFYQNLYYLFGAIISLSILFIYSKKHKETKLQIKKALKSKPFYVVPFANLVNGVLFLILIKSANIGLINALLNMSVVIVVLYGTFVLKEKNTKLTYLILFGIIFCVTALSFITI